MYSAYRLSRKLCGPEVSIPSGTGHVFSVECDMAKDQVHVSIPSGTGHVFSRGIRVYLSQTRLNPFWNRACIQHTWFLAYPVDSDTY